MTEQQNAEEREIQALLADAGPRPAVPAEDLQAIRETARQAWRRSLASRDRERRPWGRPALALAATLVAALGVGWWWSTRSAPPPASPVAVVELVRGSLLGTTGASQDGSPGPGVDLYPGARIETRAETGAGTGGAALRLAGGESLRLDADTRVRLVSTSRLELERGAVYLDSGPGGGAAGIEVATSLGLVREIGTQFEVRLAESGGGLAVRVREGQVLVGDDGRSHSAVGGQALLVRSDGSVLEEKIEPFGEGWRWVIAMAPAPEIEGRSLAEFLGWVLRETGWRLRYEDPAVAESAGSVTLHGTIAGLTPVEALDLVLPGSNLDYRAQGGELWILKTGS